jgi:hypothetical protein
VKIVIKKITGLFLLLSIITPWLFIASFTIQKQVIRHRMKERLESQMLQKISIPDVEIQWAEKGKEIWVNGKLFDIEHREHRNDTTIFTGLYDEDETLLVKQMNETHNKDLPDNQFFVQLFKCFQNIFYNQHSELHFVFNKQDHFHDSIFAKPLNQFISIPTPPPQA